MGSTPIKIDVVALDTNVITEHERLTGIVSLARFVAARETTTSADSTVRADRRRRAAERSRARFPYD